MSSSTPVTSSYAPSSFFRQRSAYGPRRLRRRSSSTSASSSSAASDTGAGYLSTGESSSEADSTDSEEDSEEDEDGPEWDSEFERASAAMSGAWPRTDRPTVVKLTTAGPGSRGAHLKLALALLHARQSLASLSFSSLSTSLASLASALPSTAGGFDTLGPFIPILARLADDLERELGDEKKGREWRKGLRKEDAKALVGLRQRWTGGEGDGKGKGKQKDSEHDWVGVVRSLVAAHLPPSFLAASPTPASSAFLTSLESVLLPSSLPRLSLAGLSLTSDDLQGLYVLRRAEEVLDWYLSFSSSSSEARSGRLVLTGVRSLDLSRNKLTTLPAWVPHVLPHLETLSLSSNCFRLLPPSLTSFRELRRLRTRGNELAKRGRTKLPRRREGGEAGQWPEQEDGPVRSNTREMARLVRSRMETWASASSPSTASSDSAGPPSLLQLSLQLARASLSSIDSSNVDNIPPHLSHALSKAYTCCSCQSFITPFSTFGAPPLSLHLPPLFDRLHFLSPGVSLPTQIVLSRSPPQAAARSVSPSPVRPPPGLSLLTLEERVLLALYGRGTELTTYVIGSEEGYRHCARCMVGHLGLLEEEALGQGERSGRECACGVCEEERRVKGEPLIAEEGAREEGKSEGVMRWLRRRPGRRRKVEGE